MDDLRKSFFKESKEQSQVKTAIVSKYFWAWAKVMLGTMKKHRRFDRIAYIDLFAGPGRYEDGTNSTPLLVLEQAIADEEMQQRLVTLFNDMDSKNVRTLETAIASLPGIERLKYPPQVRNHEVGSEIVQMFEQKHFVPTFFFVDPWGYKGLSLRLVNSVLKDWGCDCVFFFNYNRINMGLSNAAVREHMEALFGEEARELSIRLDPLQPEERELTIVEAIAEALQRMGGKFVLPFRFRHAELGRTSHHLVFVSKHVLGYEIMKEIMAGESSGSSQGVPSFEYNPASSGQRLLFELSRPLDDLHDMLLRDFAGQTLKMVQVYERHQVGRPFIKKNYKEILLRLEAQGAIQVIPPASKRVKRKGVLTLADESQVTFPGKG